MSFRLDLQSVQWDCRFLIQSSKSNTWFNWSDQSPDYYYLTLLFHWNENLEPFAERNWMQLMLIVSIRHLYKNKHIGNISGHWRRPILDGLHGKAERGLNITSAKNCMQIKNYCPSIVSLRSLTVMSFLNDEHKYLLISWRNVTGLWFCLLQDGGSIYAFLHRLRLSSSWIVLDWTVIMKPFNALISVGLTSMKGRRSVACSHQKSNRDQKGQKSYNPGQILSFFFQLSFCTMLYFWFLFFSFFILYCKTCFVFILQH